MKTFKEHIEDRNHYVDLRAAQQADFERRKAMPIPPIESIHTKVLLKVMRTLLYSKGMRGLDRINPNMCMGDSYYATPELHKLGYSEDELKSELAKREHIPNAQEAKKIRQELAWRKKNR